MTSATSVPRWVRSFVHSESSVRSCARSLRRDRDARGRSGVAREREVSLLERDPARHELLESDRASTSSSATRAAVIPWTATRSRPFEITVAPAFASTFIAAGTSGVLISTRSPDALAISSSTEMSASSRPFPITISWSAVSSSSLMWWLETKTVRPSAASERSVSRIHWIPSGSSPIVGSSRIRIGGSPSSAAATPRRCRMPSEKVPARRRATLRRAPRAEHLVGSSASRSRCSGRASAGGFAPTGSDGRRARREARRRRSAAARWSRSARPDQRLARRPRRRGRAAGASSSSSRRRSAPRTR